MHEFHNILFPILMIIGAEGMFQILRFTQEHFSNSKVNADRGDRGETPNKGDFLSRMAKMQSENPENFAEKDVFNVCGTNIGAGSDTTSVSLCALLYSLITHPDAMARLRIGIQEFSDDRIQRNLRIIPNCAKDAISAGLHKGSHAGTSSNRTSL